LCAANARHVCSTSKSCDTNAQMGWFAGCAEALRFSD
jgi:hypothetical protein